MKASVRALAMILSTGMALGLAGRADADVRLPAVLTSNMVLQADAEVTLWGWADAGEHVTIAPDWSPKSATTKADDKGRWKVQFRTPAVAPGPDAFTPHSITFKGASNTITLENVLFGEVWVCSGQSNMEMFVGDHGGGYRGVDNWRAVADAAKLPGIRFFDVENAVSLTPEENCVSRKLDGKTAGWVECSPETILNFSGTGYFFGRELFDTLNVPIGLISTDWGGTPAQAWTSEESLKDFPAYAADLEWVRQQRTGDRENPMRHWWEQAEKIDAKSMAAPGEWRRADFDDSNWGMTRLPSSFSGDLENFDGLVWFRRTVTIPESWAGKDLTLSLGPIDDMDSTYFDSMVVGTTVNFHMWYVPRTYTIPGRSVTPGTHTIAIRVLDISGPGGINGDASQMFIRPMDNSADPIGIDGYWKVSPSAALADLPPMVNAGEREVNAHTPTSLSNAMIAPLTNFAIRGAIWYQGESNRDRAKEYADLLPAMITDWRKQWGRGDFPFYFVQIAPFTYQGDAGETAMLRNSQLSTLRLPNTGMAVTMDIGNPTDIHPSNKQDVGKRLALWALAKTYAKPGVVYSGPLATKLEPGVKNLRVKFDHAGGLVARGGAPSHFEICGADEKFVPATATIEGDSIVVSAPGVDAPVSVRYGWCDACAPNLFNGAGLPASPFVLRVTR